LVWIPVENIEVGKRVKESLKKVTKKESEIVHRTEEERRDTWLIHWIALSSKPSVNMANVRERKKE